jgi:hypothetical protein
MHIYKIVIINKQFNNFSSVYFKKNSGKEQVKRIAVCKIWYG